MKEKIKKLKIVNSILKIRRSLNLIKSFIKDYKIFKRYNIKFNITSNNARYYISWIVHSLEKGMSNKNPRPFGKDKVLELIDLLNNSAPLIPDNTFEYNLAISCLNSYADFYQEKNWTNQEEYKKVNSFLKNHHDDNIIKTGSYDLHKEEIIEGSSIDYDQFLNSRHSVRNFSNQKLKQTDIKKAVEMALKTPTACNRQMCKVYYIKSKELNKTLIKYSKGIGGFDTTNINFFIITYSVSAFYLEERNQGMFNSGLFSMNFVNALHSLGIGSCFLQFANSHKEEQSLKEILNIPNDERIAIVIACGYYDEISKIPYSSRKYLSDTYFER